MKQITHILTVIAALFMLCCCDDYLQPETTVPPGKIMISNDKGLDGSYVVTGPGEYHEKTEKFLSYPTIPGNYTVKFISSKLNANICQIPGDIPVYMGTTSFDTNPNSNKVVVPINEITCKISCSSSQEHVKILKTYLDGVYQSMVITGEIYTKPVQKQIGSVYYPLAIGQLQLSFNVEILNAEDKQEWKIFQATINPQPGYHYIAKIGEDGVTIFPQHP